MDLNTLTALDMISPLAFCLFDYTKAQDYSIALEKLDYRGNTYDNEIQLGLSSIVAKWLRELKIPKNQIRTTVLNML